MYNIENFQRDILENSYDGVFITDGNGIVIYVNKAYEKLAGQSRDIYIGRNMNELFDEGVMKTYISKDVVKTKEVITRKEELISGKNVLITSSPVFDDAGEVCAVVTNVRDMTELINLEKEAALSDRMIELYEKQYMEGEAKDEIICESPKTKAVFALAEKVAQKDSTVLVTGETGVGKEVVAQFIHTKSPRNNEKYIKINCGAIPTNLLESELFGYVAGAFTGAEKKGKMGIFELADKGTLFLDEIGELPLSLQASLLRVLQDGEIIRIGDVKTRKVDVRLVAATNRNLETMVEEGTFRKDLYYRLDVFAINIPPLRERTEDIPALAEYFMKQLNKKYNEKKTLTNSYLMQLMAEPWPGNIRELANFVERQFIMDDTNVLNRISLNSIDAIGNANPSPFANSDIPEQFDINEIMNAVEASLMKRAINQSKNGNDAAVLLGMSQPTFSRKYNKYKEKGLL